MHAIAQKSVKALFKNEPQWILRLSHHPRMATSGERDQSGASRTRNWHPYGCWQYRRSTCYFTNHPHSP